MCDTGATCNLVSLAFANRVGLHLVPTIISVSGVGGFPVPVSGESHVLVRVSQRASWRALPVVVTETMDYTHDFLLGKPGLIHLGLLPREWPLGLISEAESLPQDLIGPSGGTGNNHMAVNLTEKPM